MVSALVCDATMRISYGVKKIRKHLLPRPALTSPITTTSRAAAAVLMLPSSSSARGQDVATRHFHLQLAPALASSSAAEAARSEEWRPITRPGASVQMVHTRREVARLDTAVVGRSAISLVLGSFSMKYKYPNWIQIPLLDTQVYYSCLCSLCYFHGRAALVVVNSEQNTVSGPKLCKQHPRLATDRVTRWLRWLWAAVTRVRPRHQRVAAATSRNHCSFRVI